MKLAVVSDIHGNLAALQAVLADIQRRGADVLVNLGDSLSGPLYPAETADLLISLKLPTIRGNHERQLLESDPAEMNKSDSYAHCVLRPEHRAWLNALPKTLWLTEEVFLCHGTPESDLAYFLETVEPAGVRLATEQEAAARAGSIAASLILCGHTHMPRQMRLADGRLIVNPGSVGLQAYDWDVPYPHKMEVGTTEARYALIEKTTAGWQASFMAVPYDWDSAATLAESRARPDWAVALRTGHC